MESEYRFRTSSQAGKTTEMVMEGITAQDARV